MPSRTRPGIVVAQVLTGSIVTWAVTGLLTASIHLFGDRPWASALQISTFFVIVLVLGYAAVGLGGGVVAIPSTVFRRMAVTRRDRVEDDPGGLTPLGLALFVIPQLVVAAALLG
jgi:hypothetical protein